MINKNEEFDAYPVSVILQKIIMGLCAYHGYRNWKKERMETPRGYMVEETERGEADFGLNN